MSDLSALQSADQAGLPLPRPRWTVVALTLAVLALAPGELGSLTRALITDAYVQVSVFVAMTLLLFYGAERAFGFNIADGCRERRPRRCRWPRFSVRRPAAAVRWSSSRPTARAM